MNIQGKSNTKHTLREYRNDKKIQRLISFIQSKSPNKIVPKDRVICKIASTQPNIKQKGKLNQAINLYLKNRQKQSSLVNFHGSFLSTRQNRPVPSQRLHSQQKDVFFPSIKSIKTQSVACPKQYELSPGNLSERKQHFQSLLLITKNNIKQKSEKKSEAEQSHDQVVKNQKKKLKKQYLQSRYSGWEIKPEEKDFALEIAKWD